jgi:hypothetical protein
MPRVLRKGSKGSGKNKTVEKSQSKELVSNDPRDHPVRVLGRAADMGTGKQVNSAVGVSGEDLTSVLLATQSGTAEIARAQRKYGSSTVLQIAGQLMRPSLIDYPTILAGLQEIELTREQLVEEIELVLEIGEVGSSESPLIYSLRIVAPARWAWPTDGPSVSTIGSTPGRVAELETGYIHSDILFGLPPIDRGSLLEQILSTADAVEINVSLSGRVPMRTTVTLRSD